MLATILFILLFSAATTFFFTPLTILIANKFGLIDNPKIRPHPAHTHKGIIPRAGGLPIFLGIFLPSLFLIKFNPQLTGIFLGATILIVVGLWDDKKDRSPYIRFITNIVAALCAVAVGVGIPYITNPLGGVIHLDNWIVTFDINGIHTIVVWADILAIFWIIWTTNIVGWSGGVDGQLPGFVSICAFVIGLISLRFATADPAQLHVTYLSIATAGAFLGFIPWNFYPQKIMPGYGGKTLAGFMLAVLSILSFSKLGTALLVLAVPMIDASFTLLSRIFSGKSPVNASAGHLHHHLLSLGWGRRAVAIFYWVISALAGFAALLLRSEQKVFAGILTLILVCMFIFWINFIKKLPGKQESEEY